MEILAPAKVNLSLRILGPRPDGYHEIESLVQKVDLCDRIILEEKPGKGISLRCSDPEIPAGSGNIAYRAAQAVIGEAKIADRGIKITLEKNIPTGAGLGGGSSDAAAVLDGLNRMWNLSLERSRLIQLAAGLGSDVPLFLFPSPSLIRGRGEIVLPVNLRIPSVFLIVFPGFSISTSWAYSNFRLTNNSREYRLSKLLKAEGGKLFLERWKEFLGNDLEESTLKHFPRIALCKKVLLQSGAEAAFMSGSGSAVFGLFDNLDRVANAAAKLSAQRGFRVMTAIPLFS